MAVDEDTETKPLLLCLWELQPGFLGLSRAGQGVLAQPGLSLPVSGARSWVGAAVGTPGMCSQFSQQSSVLLLLLQGLGTGAASGTALR